MAVAVPVRSPRVELARPRLARHRGRRRDSRALLLAPRPPASGFRGGLDQLLTLSNELPVERDVGILRLDLAEHVRLEGSRPTRTPPGVRNT